MGVFFVKKEDVETIKEKVEEDNAEALIEKKAEEIYNDEIDKLLEDGYLSPSELARIFRKRARNDFDAVVAITGEEGISKSTLATWIVYNSLLLSRNSEEKAMKKLNDFLIFSPNKQKIQEQIITAPRYSIISADEAIKILYKQNWASKIQKFLNMFYALCRKENKITLLCMPRFTDFNEFFRNHRIKFWIHVIDRGVGVLFSKDWNPFNNDPWMVQNNLKLVGTMHRRKNIVDYSVDDKVAALKKLKIFVGMVKFEDLTPELKEIYKQGKEKFGYDDLEEQIETTKEELLNKKYSQALAHAVTFLSDKFSMNNTQIAATLDVDANSIRTWKGIKRKLKKQQEEAQLRHKYDDKLRPNNAELHNKNTL